jgi:hypothetical protein
MVSTGFIDVVDRRPVVQVPPAFEQTARRDLLRPGGLLKRALA